MADPMDRFWARLADRYRYQRPLGVGGMATVHLARDLKHGRDVAVKVLRPELAATLGRKRFLREIHLTAVLTHPHILPLLDSGEEAGTLYYVMPHVAGESLRDRLDREPQLPIDEAVRIAAEVADALAYTHSRNVVHRDIKPGNILLAGARVLVTDLGIGRAVDVAGGDRLTESGIVVGTPAYMSPEQGRGGDGIDGRSDIYSLGCVLFEMLVGEPPFGGLTRSAVFARHALDPPPPPQTVRTQISDALQAIVLRALGKSPSERFKDAAEFASALWSLARARPPWGLTR